MVVRVWKPLDDVASSGKGRRELVGPLAVDQDVGVRGPAAAGKEAVIELEGEELEEDDRNGGARGLPADELRRAPQAQGLCFHRDALDLEGARVVGAELIP